VGARGEVPGIRETGLGVNACVLGLRVEGLGFRV
jgi:hypothetical protein